ncbi:Probable outer membrane component of multidrug efflux pump [hydrothermal vent metagenome]|uniref:Probable outer membrane component of multidrug efflux pump n=1 Tax=hydrothermal vent metagenome TaxID=652676 RepID=A0A1W1E866_9ZZZZ
MKKLLLILLPLLGTAQESVELAQLIDHALKHNGQIESKQIAIQSKEEEIASAKSAYWPTLDVGGSYSVLTPTSIVQPGRTATLYASVHLELYDGGRKAALLRAKKYEKEASFFEKEAFSKSVTLQIVRHYYTLKQMQANLQALRERSKELKAQIVRVKRFKLTGLATQEAVDKLQSVYDSNQYTIENIKLGIETAKENLKLLSGMAVDSLGSSRFATPHGVHFAWFDVIKTMRAQAMSAGENAKVIDANYMPQVGIGDTYHHSDFDNVETLPPLFGTGGSDAFLVDHQNEVKLSVNMRLFDKGRMRHESEAVRMQKLALLSALAHAKKEQSMHFKLAAKALETTRAKIKSAQSALKAAQSTYVTIKKKFEAGLVDDIAYLDALAQRTLAEARYKETAYDYEIKKSLYYYYAGKDPREYIR